MRLSNHRRIARRQIFPPDDSSTPSPPSATDPVPSTTAPATTPSHSPTSTTATPSSTSDGGLLSGIFGPNSSSSSSSSSSPSSSTIPTSVSTNPRTGDSHTYHAQPITSPAATVISSGSLSTSSVTITSSSATATQANANNDSGPIAGGVIGGIFAIAGLGMLISFVLRRWRRRQIDKAVFGTTDFRKSAMALDDDASSETPSSPQQQRNNPRPPTMIERRVAGTPAPAQQRMHAGGPPGGYGQPFYPPQSMQMGYYPQQPDRPYTPHLQPAAYNQMYNGGGYNVPPARTQTTLLNPYEASAIAGDGESAGEGPP
ncbi:hypothetical protein APHAL10511_003979 [Amanita phalloides]|nr:hypothetical protein APHAL10511_003979 [Amanita phalloides]